MRKGMKVFMPVSNTQLQGAFPGGSKIRGSSYHSPLLQEEKHRFSQSRDPGEGRCHLRATPHSIPQGDKNNSAFITGQNTVTLQPGTEANGSRLI